MDVLQKIDNKFENQTALAIAVGVKQPVVSRWLSGKDDIPPLRATQIEKLTGIPREEIRPDVFGK
jgi:DNA-binding transcriptional regulator YdaS (Cro superfamily)